MKLCTECNERPIVAKGLCSRCYDKTPEKRAKRQEYRNRPEIKERMRLYMIKYLQRPEVKERIRAYHAQPEVRERRRAYARDYAKRPEAKIKIREYQNRPEIRERARLRDRSYIAPFVLVGDFEKYFIRLFKRTAPDKRDELLKSRDVLKQRYVNSVEMVIDGGLELKVAERLAGKKFSWVKFRETTGAV